MDVIIEYNSGATRSLVDEGYITKDLIIKPIEHKTSKVDLEGRPGVVREYLGYGSRSILLPIRFIASDELDFALKRDKLFGIFSDIEPFYIYEARPTYKTTTYDFELPGESFGPNNQLPKNLETIKGKRYNVVRISMSEVEQQWLMGFCDVEFETYQLPFAESKGTTLDELTFSREYWQTGQGLILEDPTQLKYVFQNTNSFRVFNAGNVPVNMAYRDMLFEIEVKGATSNLTITNNTNNTSWKYNGTNDINGIIKLETPTRFTKNGVSIFKDTNKANFILNPGWNDISITGTSQFLATFKFKFYYK